MAERFMDEDVKTRLILSGIEQIETSGIKDFSLRRAAESAGVSCAAPYRYFKSKEDYIANIYSYLAEKWQLLLSEIERAYNYDKREFFIEALCANIRFWLANKNLRSALMFVDDDKGSIKLSDFDKDLFEKISEYLSKSKKHNSNINVCIVSIRASLYGFITLIGAGELSLEEDDLKNIKNSFMSFL